MTQTQRNELDPTFGVNGKLDVRPPGNFRNDLSNLVLDATGRRLMIYGSYERETPDLQIPGVGALIDDGAFDTRFGDTQDGLTTVPPVNLAASVSSIARLTDGSFFVTGAAYSQLPLINYDQNGKFISIRDIAVGPQSSTPRLLGLDDKFLLATSNRSGGVVHRHHFDGEQDGSFGNAGIATFLTGNTYVSTLHMARSVNTTAFYLAGEVGNDGFILRMNDAGELDLGFADGGVYAVRMIDARYTACRRVIELGNGKIVALINSSNIDNSATSYLIGLTSTGQIDVAFNRGEPLRVPGEIGEDMALQADGKILVAHRGVMTGNKLTRYFPDGGLDIEFGTDATGSITFTDEQIGFVKSVTVQPDGKIVVGGTSGSTTTLLRLMA